MEEAYEVAGDGVCHCRDGKKSREGGFRVSCCFVSTRFVPLTGILLSFRNTAQGPSCGSGCSQWLLQVPTYVIAASFMGQAENPKSEHLIYDSAHPEIEHQHGATVDIPTLQSFVVCIKL